MPGEFLRFALPGSVLLCFGLVWTWVHAAPKVYHRVRRSDCCEGCCSSLDRHPVEGLIKIVVSLVGIAASLFAAYPDGSLQYVGDVHFASAYLFFALSGVVDVLACYCPRAVSPGTARLSLALAFFVEAYIYYLVTQTGLTSVAMDVDAAGLQAQTLLEAAMLASAASTALAGVFTGLESARCLSVLVHGSWMLHCGVLLDWPGRGRGRVPDEPLRAPLQLQGALWVSVAFAWHVAAALSLLVVLLVVRRVLCARRVAPKPRLGTSPGSLSIPLPHGPGCPGSPHSCPMCVAAATYSTSRHGSSTT